MTTLDQDRKAKAVLNERVKLAATYLNGLAITILIAIGVSPMFAGRGESPPVDAVVDPALVNLLGGCLLSVAMHVAAQVLLRRIEP